MPATSGSRKREIKREMLSKAKTLSTAIKKINRKRQNYLSFVVQGNLGEMRKEERAIVRKLFLHGSSDAKSGLRVRSIREQFTRYLRWGIPLSNAIHLLELVSRYRQVGELHLPMNPRFRKPAVLKMEMEILEYEYISLRLARRNAIAHGYPHIATALAKEIERFAKKIAHYHALFKSERLVEQ